MESMFLSMQKKSSRQYLLLPDALDKKMSI